LFCQRLQDADCLVVGFGHRHPRHRKLVRRGECYMQSVLR
jgi:hypothetical protein